MYREHHFVRLHVPSSCYTQGRFIMGRPLSVTFPWQPILCPPALQLWLLFLSFINSRWAGLQSTQSVHRSQMSGCLGLCAQRKMPLVSAAGQELEEQPSCGCGLVRTEEMVRSLQIFSWGLNPRWQKRLGKRGVPAWWKRIANVLGESRSSCQIQANAFERLHPPCNFFE